MKSGKSSVWCEQLDAATWRVGLGLNTVNGPAYDWQLQFRLPQTDTMTISTPNVLTKDGAQVHRDEYLETRQLVVAGVVAGELPRNDAECAASERGLSFIPAPFATPPTLPLEAGFTIMTALTQDEILELLPLLGFHRTETRPDGGRWLIGLESAENQSHAELVVRDDGALRCMDFMLQLRADQLLLTSSVTVCHARRFAAIALSLVSHVDRNARRVGGNELLDGSS
jgi:hypothetical protein